MCYIYNWKNEINDEELKEVVQILKNEGVIIFPTETVYGIGGNATSALVVDKVYKIKKRPREKAINILLSSKDQIEKYAIISSELERKIIDFFMPGPITLILKKRADFGKGFTLDDDTIGIRIPDNKIISTILKNVDFPLIAPSANISGKPSGTNAKEIAKDFEKKVDAIIDGGEAKIGLSSTIVKVDGEQIKILRQGSITLEQILERVM